MSTLLAWMFSRVPLPRIAMSSFVEDTYCTYNLWGTLGKHYYRTALFFIGTISHTTIAFSAFKKLLTFRGYPQFQQHYNRILKMDADRRAHRAAPRHTWRSECHIHHSHYDKAPHDTFSLCHKPIHACSLVPNTAPPPLWCAPQHRLAASPLIHTLTGALLRPPTASG